MPHPSKRVDRVCEKCGQAFSVPASRVKFGPAKFCSTACKNAAWREDGAGERLLRKEAKCEACEKAFIVTSKDARRFCSHACAIKWRDNPERPGRKVRGGQGKVKLTCEQCGKEFTRYASRVKGDRGRFCSRPCLGAWVCARRVDVRESKLERDFAATLRGHGLIFETQHRVEGFALDIAFPGQKVAVEVDGDYWHSLPKMVARDKKKDAVLTSVGWRVVHLPEHVIKKNPGKAVEEVFNALK